MSIDHYENFPVASRLLPSRLRPAVLAIYRFARAADDIADEGDAAPGERLAGLDSFRGELERIAAGATSHSPLFADLKHAIDAHRLPLQPLHDLLDAFRQDVIKTRYRDYAELLDYCRRSANPVGSLLLHLYRASDAPNLACSDAVCTGLQLINFWQDMAIDWSKGRVYLPQDELCRFAVTEAQIASGHCDEHWRALMRFQIARARKLILQGAPLAGALSGRIGLELRFIIAGGLRILDKLEHSGADVFRRRPQLRRRDWPALMWQAART